MDRSCTLDRAQGCDILQKDLQTPCGFEFCLNDAGTYIISPGNSRDKTRRGKLERGHAVRIGVNDIPSFPGTCSAGCFDNGMCNADRCVCGFRTQVVRKVTAILPMLGCYEKNVQRRVAWSVDDGLYSNMHIVV